MSVVPAEAVLRRKSLPRFGPLAWGAIVVLSGWVAVALLAPFIAPFGEGEIVSMQSFAEVPEAGLLGTDYLGRDLISRLLYGARMTMGVALASALLACLIGILLGFLAAVLGGWTDQLLSRLVDALLSFPSVVFALVLIGGLGTSLPVIVVTVALIQATGSYRIARALGNDLIAMDFVDAARARGESAWRIMSREILPNASAPLLADFGLRYTYAILIVSALSFLGLGVQPPSADWGVMVKENVQGLFLGSSAALIPAACIASVTVSVNLVVDAFVERGRAGHVPEMLP